MIPTTPVALDAAPPDLAVAATLPSTTWLTIVALGALALIAAVWLLRRLAAGPPPGARAAEIRRPSAAGEAAAEAAPPAPRARPVDPAVANILAEAAAPGADARSDDDLYPEAVRVVAEIGTVSVPAIQRRLHVDFDRAHGLVERMVADGFVTPASAGSKRKVLPPAYEFVERLGGSE